MFKKIISKFLKNSKINFIKSIFCVLKNLEILETNFFCYEKLQLRNFDFFISSY